MIIIREANKEIKLLWYHSSIKRKECAYRPVTFLLKKNLGNKTLLCNTVTGEMVLLSNTEEESFSSLPGIFQDSLSELILHKFVVPVDYDELAEIKNLKTILLRRVKKNCLNSYNILPTTYCNARCFYCYQSEMDHLHMSEATAGKLVDFIDRYSDHTNVKLSWFGGEPLLGEKRINYICNSLTQRNIKFTSEITSNCFLFNEDLVYTAKKTWNLRNVQVTLDGTETVYNCVKSYINPAQNPFKRVLKNIKLLLDQDINVGIRLNLDTHNADDLLELIKELGKLFSERKKLFVYISLLKEDVGFTHIHHSEKEHSSLVRHGYELEKEISKNGLKGKVIRSLPYLKLFNCMANNPYAIQCAPNGLLGKCEDKIFEHTIGSINDSDFNIEELKWWGEEEILKDCETCAFLPVCPHLKNCPLNKHHCESYSRMNMYRVYLGLMEDFYMEYVNKNSFTKF